MDSNQATQQLTSIVNKVAGSCTTISHTSPIRNNGENRKSVTRTNEYNHNVQNSKRTFKKARRKFKNDHNSITKRQAFLAAKKKYKNLIYHI